MKARIDSVVAAHLPRFDADAAAHAFLRHDMAADAARADAGEFDEEADDDDL